MKYIADTDRNPFGMNPPCERHVPGFGAVDADFHVVGDNPRVHGGEDTAIPFTDRSWSESFFDALVEGGLVRETDLATGDVVVPNTFFSYLHMCHLSDDGPDYATMEAYFDSELRAITAHVLFPVGARATRYVLEHYTPHPTAGLDMEALHATELQGSGWLVVPIKQPAEWTDSDETRLVEALQALLARDYRQASDLGRFLPGDDPYIVR